ncbi:MAG: YegS/Rv2252/BmrU family lipid kinase [Candidatus Dadabacteria bacterium]|nr:YegS/Rv2252/BmrU family lipid kinase [Candidatus Dadabacteria bacterium]NIS07229.1 YegS/Rv2252/BmrU family lipid kinase [Candidatus Dadabacteria bacterium]NIV40936.1 YegS/Rv2252/BmrU family lipid kinase [Candidatus Dadabacteria bacterium]NIX14368.1 YegS/Rv2252/BmrU family lipid kinase [Candidatus Dadabacteria bacterium]NIY20886.1 YegS/Rv2252/BmrU family lipid kinase [Candidatus Dadabacteria bacterium]
MNASKNKKYGFIVNTKSGRRNAKARVKLAEDFADANGLDYEIFYTEHRGHATELAAQCAKEGYGVVVAVGGDGTSHEVANALVGTETALAILPSGSGNDFPKSVDIPLDFMDALKVLANHNIKQVDVGLLENEFFTNGIGFGMDGAVAHRFKDYSIIRGELAYMLGAVIEAFSFPGFRADVAVDHWRFSGKVLLAGASNGSYHGGKFQLAPSARVDDGLLDMYIIKNMPILSRLVQIPKVLNGTHVSLDEVYIKGAARMEVTLDKPVPAHMDGEPFILQSGYHKIEVKSKALKVLSAK